MATTSAILQILVKVRDDAAGALSRISGDVSELGGQMNFLGDKAGVVAGALAAIGAGAFFANAIVQVREANREWLKTETLLKGTGVSLEEVRKRAEEMAETSIFQAHEIGTVYARNIGLFGDTAKAVDKTKLAMDIAAFTGKDLASVQKIISKVSEENIMALSALAREMGVVVPENIHKAANQAEQFEIILGAVRDRVASFDKQLLESDALIQLRKQWNDLVEQIGEFVLPIINELLKNYVIPMIVHLRKWADEHPGLAKGLVLVAAAITALIPIAFALVTLMPTFIVLFKIAAVVVGALVSPIGLIAAGIVALGVAAYVFRDKWIPVWNAIRDFTIPIIEQLRSMIDGLRNTFENVKNAITAPIQRAGSFISGIASRAAGILGFQHGGIVTRPTLGLVGEAGPEAIVPLRRVGAFGATINIYLQGDFYTTAQVAEEFGNEIARVIKNQINVPMRA